MKKLLIFIICLISYPTIFAQDEKKSGDEMAAAANYSGAAVMYQLCMETDEECRLKLFRLLYDKKITSQTPDELYTIISPLAKKKNVEAQFYVGKIYSNGLGVKKNDKEAFNWTKRSAAGKYSDAQNELGRMYMTGLGVKRNLKEAKKWYQLSAAQGNAEAQHQLELMSREALKSEASKKETTSEKEKTAARSKSTGTNSDRKNEVHLGVGIGGTLYYDYGYSSRLPAFSLAYERRVIENLFNDKSALGVGAVFGYTAVEGYGPWNDCHSTDLMVGVRATIHYKFIDFLDTYAGAMGGFNSYKRSSTSWQSSGGFNENGVLGAYAVFVGARYYITDLIGLFAEGGYGYTYVSAGLSIRF